METDKIFWPGAREKKISPGNKLFFGPSVSKQSNVSKCSSLLSFFLGPIPTGVIGSPQGGFISLKGQKWLQCPIYNYKYLRSGVFSYFLSDFYFSFFLCVHPTSFFFGAATRDPVKLAIHSHLYAINNGHNCIPPYAINYVIATEIVIARCNNRFVIDEIFQQLRKQ